MNVIQIIEKHLKDNGFDGLVHVDTECGCLVDDLSPCGECPGNCVPGYRGPPGPDSDWPDTTWMMYPTKKALDKAIEAAAKAEEATP